jgi:UDP-2,3-diacylglucosamine pyrophosphatase LpxH
MWKISRRSFLLSGFLALLSEIPGIAGVIPTLKLNKSLNSTSLQFTVTAPSAGTGYLEYGMRAGFYESRTSKFVLAKQLTTTVTGLKPGTKYYFRLRYKLSGKSYLATSFMSITTQSVANTSIFAIQADPHMDENSSEDVYNKTLDLIAGSGAAFLIDLGDIFMVDKLADKSDANIRARYQLMKNYYQRLKGLPLKIVLGNHDGELGYSSFNTKSYRAEYFPEQTGSVAYFAHSESDVLHIGLDPFTYTTSNPKADGWQWTLGKTQYDWLTTTLQNSTERHKFVYIHHLLVGDAQSRGGTHIASFNEWGGKNMDGTDGFSKMRPGWAKPVHQLLKDNGVSIVFKGHDHLYVKEEMDGLIYQTLPQPSHPGDGTNSAIQYGYGAGKVIGGSGYLRVKTDSDKVQVDFVKYDGSIADSYIV